MKDMHKMVITMSRLNIEQAAHVRQALIDALEEVGYSDEIVQIELYPR